MSESPLEQIIHHLLAALRVASQTRAPERLRSAIINALLTANFHDPARMARMEAHLMAEVPGPRAVGERLALVPMVGPTRDEQPRAVIGERLAAEVTGNGDADLERAAREAVVRTNVRPFIAAAAAAREHVTRPETLAQVVDQAQTGRLCGHPWHVMVNDGVTPFNSYCPAGCGANVNAGIDTTAATVDRATVATPVDACGATDGDYGTCSLDTGHDGRHVEMRDGKVWAAWSGQSPVDACGHVWHAVVRDGATPKNERCPDCDATAAVQHSGDYVVTGHPEQLRLSEPNPQVTAIMRQDDGDTTGWTAHHTPECFNRDCAGCVA
jgi:hypothetical protein